MPALVSHEMPALAPPGGRSPPTPARVAKWLKPQVARAGMALPSPGRMNKDEPFVGPRERLHERGLDSLSDAELVALLLGTGTRDESVVPLADRLLRELGGLRGLGSAGTGDLLQVRGIGASKAARLQAGVEL